MKARILIGMICGVFIVGAVYRVTRPVKVASEVVIEKDLIADGGLFLAYEYTGEIRDPGSLEELRGAVLQRGRGGLAAFEAKLDALSRLPAPNHLSAARLYYSIGALLSYNGRFQEASLALEKALAEGEAHGMPPRENAKVIALLGVLALRQGEIDNCIACVGPSSCIFPIVRDAVHLNKSGSEQAVRYFTRSLDMVPGDLRIRWLLNIACMTLGQYPESVPPRYLIPLDWFQSSVDVGRFQNVAPLVGLTSRGPNEAGGSIFDDFSGDALPDLFTTSLDADRGASLYVNRGDGTFEDHSEEAGLNDQVYALNVTRADFDNDGNLDVLLLRGGWEKPLRMSLLRNLGNASFEDVTTASGLGVPIATESAAWGDYDNDGLIDLFVCGEYYSPRGADDVATPDARNRCRLYHNEGRGTFMDVAKSAGVDAELCAKGCAWGDYDGDGRLDLFVSNMTGPCRLYHQEKDGTFRDLAPDTGLSGPERAFACWFWDYDNDGRLDLYVNNFSSSLAEFVAEALNLSHDQASRPRLYRNTGAEFRDVTREVGLDRSMSPMGCNFGDIDNDGFLDIYLGTGDMSLEYLVPNLMFRNNEGRFFDDVSMSSGTGHLQKGHGVSFADYDADGELDLFVEVGGAVPGDRSFNLLFRNPGHGHHWLKVKLVGTTSNRSALGAQVKAVVPGSQGKTRTIYRTIGNNSSFGGNSLVETIGLLNATSVAELVVSWPASGRTQVFHNIDADQSIEITEGVDSIRSVPTVGVRD